MTDIRLASPVYVGTYCVPIAHLRQNKLFPLLYLGHAQIKNKPFVMLKRNSFKTSLQIWRLSKVRTAGLIGDFGNILNGFA